MLPLKKCHFTHKKCTTLGLRNFFYMKILLSPSLVHCLSERNQPLKNFFLLLCRLFYFNNMLILGIGTQLASYLTFDLKINSKLCFDGKIHLKLCFDMKIYLKLCFDVKIHLKLCF